MLASSSAAARRRPLLAVLISLVLVAGITPLVPSAAALTIDTRPITTACPTGQVPDPGFTDIATSPYRAEIACAAAYGAVLGTTTTTYSPDGTVTRGQLASYLARLLTASGMTRPSVLPNRFTDDDGSTHEANINWLAALGVVRGYGDGTYGPTRHVTRAQVASYLNQTIDVIEGAPLWSNHDVFRDDQTSVHHANINALAWAGIIHGVGDSYFPARDLIRGPMAAFVARVLDLLVEDGELQAPLSITAIRVTPTTATSLAPSTSATSNRGARSYEAVVGLGIPQVTIVLLPASSVTFSGTTPLFTSTTRVPASFGTSIEVVNGRTITAAAVGAGTTQLTRVTPVNGRVTFTIDSVFAQDVVPVVYDNTILSATDQLDLVLGSGARAAAEPVGVGGRATWVATEPATGVNLGVGTVRQVNLGARTYTLDLGGEPAPEALLRWSTSDDFRYTAASLGTITRTQFETWVSVGDRVDPSAYRVGDTTHTIVGDVPLAPTAVSTVSGPSAVTVSFVKPSNPVATLSTSSFRLERATVTGTSIGSYVEVAAIAGNVVAQFSDVPPASGTYAYRVIARSSTGSSPASAASQVVFAALTPATTASSLTDNNASGAGGPNGVLDTGDRLVFTFDRAVTVPVGWSIQLIDLDGTLVTLSSTNATVAVTVGGTVLTVTLTATPAPTPLGAEMNVGTGGFLQVVVVGGIGNVAGVWNLPKSGTSAAPYANTRVVIGRELATPAPIGPRAVSGSTFTFGTNETQLLSATGNTSGTFQLGFGGQQTAALPYTATSGDIATALQAAIVAANPVLYPTGTTHVTVAPTGAWSSLSGGPMRISFTGSLSATDVATLTLHEVSLTGGAAAQVSPEVEGAGLAGFGPGDTITVFNAAGTQLGSSLYAPTSRTSVSVGSTITAGTTYYAVVTEAGVPVRSQTAVLIP